VFNGVQPYLNHKWVLIWASLGLNTGVCHVGTAAVLLNFKALLLGNLVNPVLIEFSYILLGLTILDQV
jgi:hypothetical protein